MILIIEGLDGTGKSTLIKNLRKEYFNKPRTIMIHSTVPPLGVNPSFWEEQHYTDILDEAIDLQYRGFDVIFDRAHLGAAVYGELYRNCDPEPIFDLEENFVADSIEEEVALVLLTDSPEAGWTREDGDSVESNVTEYAQTREKFIDAFNESSIKNKLHIDITQNGGFANTLPSVIEFLEKVRR